MPLEKHLKKISKKKNVLFTRRKIIYVKARALISKSRPNRPQKLLQASAGRDSKK